MANGIIPQQVLPPSCPTCHRPVYQDVEHNPVCAAVQNLETVVMKGAGALEEEGAERWADLHERMTGVKHEVVEKLETEVAALKQRIEAIETKVSPPAETEKPPTEGVKETQDKPAQSGGEQVVTS